MSFPLFEQIHSLRIPQTRFEWVKYYLYRTVLSIACLLASGSILLQFGFQLPEQYSNCIVWLNFITICLFLFLTIAKVVESRKTAAPVRYAVLECIIILALVVEFLVLHLSQPEHTSVSLRLVQLYLFVVQFFFAFELGRQMFAAGKQLFLLSFSPALTVSISFMVLILFGALALMLPHATFGKLLPNISFIDALFTSTSAVCVTGLTVVDTATVYSRFGQAIIVLLIQLGAFGIMIAVGLFAFTFRSGSSLRTRSVLQDILVKEGSQRVTSLLRTMLITTFILESIGALLLIPGFYPNSHSVGEAVFHSIFHSISAFCNAGFSTFPNNLESYSGSPLVVLTIAVLIVGGGIGFSVIHEILIWFRDRYFQKTAVSRLSLHSVTVLKMTAILISVGTVLVYLGGDWGGRSGGNILLSSLFQSITPRTAGFNTIPLHLLAPWSLIIIILLMFIGGAPGGTAGGIKVSTVALLYHTTLSLLKGRREVEIGRRTIAQQAVMTAFVISGMGVAYVTFATILMVWAHPNLPFFDLFFEVVSAFGTVGLSLGITPQLSTMGKLIIIITMYLGRVGPLTVFLGLMPRRDEALYKYPSGNIVVG